MIKYRPTTFLLLLLSYALLGVIPFQGANVNDKNFEYYWEESSTRLTYTGKGDFKEAVKALNRKFPTEVQKRKLKLICGYIRKFCVKNIYENNISILILDNIESFPYHLDLTKAKDLNGFNDIRQDIINKITTLSFPSLDDEDIISWESLLSVIRFNIKGTIPLREIEKINEISRKKSRSLYINLSESQNLKEYLKKVIELEIYNEEEGFIGKVELPESFKDNEIPVQLKNQGWRIDPYKKTIKIIHLIKGLKYYTIDEKKKLKGKIEQLIKEGADLNAKDSYGDSPLAIAVLENNLEIVTFLIKNSADANEKDNYGRISFYPAVLYGYREMVTLLIENSADVNAKDNKGERPLFQPFFYKYLEIATLLVGNGADVNEKDNKGDSLLHFTALLNNLEMATLLIKNGVDINAKNNDGDTSLQIARQKNNLAMINLLRGKSVTNNNKNTSLIENDANVNGENENTPSYSDYENNHSEINTSLAGNNSEASRSTSLITKQ